MITFESSAKKFIKKLPYKVSPFSGRNWGNKWHSLCSYHGKLKPAIAHFLISEFTKKGDVVLDPLCGVGTIPLEACLQGRIGVGNDLSELAYVVTKAKLEHPNKQDVICDIKKLEDYINLNLPLISDPIPYSDFGYNKKLSEYFEAETFKEIICARNYFKQLLPNISASQAMVFSALLHVLHGNRPYALSRNSHPLTPYAPSGEYIYKNVIEHITNKIELVYKQDNFQKFKTGKAIFGDYTNIGGMDSSVDWIISSPPFSDSIRFYMSNWMRLWLCGWEEKDFTEADNKFLDSKQSNDFDIYKLFFEKCNSLLKQDGKMILHLGKTEKYDMAKELENRATEYFNVIYVGRENVEDIEKHGIKDKGATTEHIFMFLQKK